MKHLFICVLSNDQYIDIHALTHALTSYLITSKAVKNKEITFVILQSGITDYSSRNCLNQFSWHVYSWQQRNNFNSHCLFLLGTVKHSSCIGSQWKTIQKWHCILNKNGNIQFDISSISFNITHMYYHVSQTEFNYSMWYVAASIRTWIQHIIYLIRW